MQPPAKSNSKKKVTSFKEVLKPSECLNPPKRKSSFTFLNREAKEETVGKQMIVSESSLMSKVQPLFYWALTSSAVTYFSPVFCKVGVLLVPILQERKGKWGWLTNSSRVTASSFRTQTQTQARPRFTICFIIPTLSPFRALNETVMLTQIFKDTRACM